MAKNKIEIPRLILDHLLQYGNTSILGLGSLSFEQHSAYLSDDKSQIFPPSHTLKYKDEVENTDQFVTYVAHRLGIKPAKALEKVDKYAQDLLNSLLNYGKAEIPLVGAFIKENGKDIDFKPFPGAIDSEFFALPPVALSPIQFFKSGEVNDNEMAVSTANMPARTKSAALSDTTATQSTYNYNDDEDTNWLKPLFWILGLVLLSALLYKGCEQYRNSQVKDPQLVIDDTPAVNDDLKNGDEATNDEVVNDSTHNESTNKPATITSRPTECVIILGAFESARNAMKMSTKVSSLGYQPYEEYFDTMDVTRVGFKFDCRDKDLRDFIYEVRKEIAPDAWYLVPRITVE